METEELIDLQIEKEIEEALSTMKQDQYKIYLINDDHNSFDHVIEVLMLVCKHEPIQAEQCALLTHHKGSCEVKVGPFEKLIPIYDGLTSNGLTAKIDK
jgi:ATP-dependent Clp protease adaptor protein ClpS